MARKILKGLFNRISIVILLICVQVIYFVFAVWKLSLYSQYISWGMTLISVVVVLGIISHDENPSFKLAWCIAILAFPLFGGLFYLIVRKQTDNKAFRERLQSTAQLTPALTQSESVLRMLCQCSEDAAIQAKYLVSKAGFPVYDASGAVYLPLGEVFVEELITRLGSAEKFIFMEYFIIADGKMWNRILPILKQKAADGVDVRVMYDSMGSLFLNPDNYYKQLEEQGIKCVEFNRFRPTASSIQNNRDHRKICVIDGRYAFTGGINIGDEYINQLDRCGHWKDNSVMIIGDAVKSFTHMFLQLWNSCRGEADNRDYLSETLPKIENDGFIIPYADTPWDDEFVSMSVYMNMISRAKKYLYITTPYFIIGDEFITALELAAKSGVDVRVITPGVWDKKFVYITTCSYYERLIKAGIRVYQYTPGFIHAKTFICDDEIATVGTSNVDYRSMYLQYECGAWMFGCSCIKDIKEDILDIIEKSNEITYEQCRNTPLKIRVAQRLFQPFAPLM